MNWLDRLKLLLRTCGPPNQPAGRIAGDEGEPSPATGRRQVTLYTRRGCHLCEDAKQALEKHQAQFGLSIVEIDIDLDPALKAAYDCCVPVVEMDGKVRFRGQVNEVLLLRLLRAAPQ